MAPSFSPKSGSSGSTAKRSKKIKVDIPDAPAAPKPSREEKAAAKRADKQAAKVSGAKRKSVSAKANKKNEKKANKEAKAQAKKNKGDQTAIKKAERSSDRATQQAKQQGRRVGDIRAAERAERARRRYRTYILRILAVVAVILVIVFGSIFLYRSNAFAIKTVNVSGVSHLTSQEITQLAAVADDSTILRIDSEGICERLETHAWIQEAHIRRHFPSTIEIVVTERTPAAAVRINEKNIWVISTDGAWLSAATEDDWNNNRRIVDVNPAIDEPVAGNDCSDEGILNALAIYDGISEELAWEIYSISAASPVKAALNLNSGVVVAFGEAEDIELKEAAIWSLLAEYEGTISYINVRIPERPTFRTV